MITLLVVVLAVDPEKERIEATKAKEENLRVIDQSPKDVGTKHKP
tara:strand:- start:795 stop:929 length:135 start_codon:yes stop_codon:yes gene_type:complete